MYQTDNIPQTKDLFQMTFDHSALDTHSMTYFKANNDTPRGVNTPDWLLGEMGDSGSGASCGARKPRECKRKTQDL